MTGLILLTGATGYVGGRLLSLLEQHGCRVRCLSRRASSLQGRVGANTEVVVFAGMLRNVTRAAEKLPPPDDSASGSSSPPHRRPGGADVGSHGRKPMVDLRRKSSWPSRCWRLSPGIE